MADERINVNEAGIEVLAQLSGIGEALAGRIVEYRETVHSFEEVIELAAVPGISERMVREIEDRITVAPAGAELAKTEGAGTDAEEPDAPEAEPEAEPAGMPASLPTAIHLPDPDEEVAAPDAEPDGDAEAEPPVLERAVPAPPPEPVPEPASSSSPVLWGHLLSAGAGALLGAVLTLLFLLLVNGSLRFATSGRAGDLEQQLGDEVAAVQAAQGELRGDVDDVSGRVATVTAGQEALAGTVEAGQADVSALGEEVEASVATLEAETVALDERLRSVAAAAENFDAFLTRMRDLLVDLQGLPPTATPTPTPTITATVTMTATPAGADAGTISPSPTPTATSAVTRTPRPTATPITLPTETAAPMP